jgi:hypothetical protein
LIRRLRIHIAGLLRLESSGFIANFIDQVAKSGDTKSFLYGYLLIDHLLRVKYVPAFDAFLPIIVQHIAEEPQLQVYELSVLGLFAAYPETHARLTDLNFVKSIGEIEISEENKGLVEKFKQNLSLKAFSSP